MPRFALTMMWHQDGDRLPSGGVLEVVRLLRMEKLPALERDRSRGCRAGRMCWEDPIRMAPSVRYVEAVVALEAPSYQAARRIAKEELMQLWNEAWGHRNGHLAGQQFRPMILASELAEPGEAQQLWNPATGRLVRRAGAVGQVLAWFAERCPAAAALVAERPAKPGPTSQDYRQAYFTRWRAALLADRTSVPRFHTYLPRRWNPVTRRTVAITSPAGAAIAAIMKVRVPCLPPLPLFFMA